jgi:hypothetical protein
LAVLLLKNPFREITHWSIVDVKSDGDSRVISESYEGVATPAETLGTVIQGHFPTSTQMTSINIAIPLMVGLS